MFEYIVIFFTLVYILVRKHFEKKYKPKKRTAKIYRLKKEKVLILFVRFSFLISVFLWVFTDYLNFADLNIKIYFRYIGIVLAVFSIWFFFLVHRELGKNWSTGIQVRKGHTLTKTGPYKKIRHPMYSSIYMVFISFAVLTVNLIVLIVPLLALTVFVFSRLEDEERIMLEVFGEEYRTYRMQTGRLVPGIRKVI